MQNQPAIFLNPNSSDYRSWSAADFLEKLALFQEALTAAHQEIIAQAQIIRKRDHEIERLEELLRLRRVQRFAASSEKNPVQLDLFDEIELEAQIASLQQQLPSLPSVPETPETKTPEKKTRQRGLSNKLPRERIDFHLSDEQKQGANRVFFKKVKEELLYLPSRLKVLEYWQECAVFEEQGEKGQDLILRAERPVHPLGKCIASIALLTYIITAKYVDGMPLYRLEQIFLRLDQEISRTVMANWLIALYIKLVPLLELFHQVQITSHYLQADETRIQVLKEDGKTAQSDKWMWVIRGGPPDKPLILFEYDPSRSGDVAMRLLKGFKGTFQADGYSGYAPLCRNEDIQRIGCWDHARRKFVEAIKAAKGMTKNKFAKDKKDKSGRAILAEAAMRFITKLYLIEREIKDSSDDKRYEVRQAHSLPILNQFKIWLDDNVNKVMKGSLTRKAVEYTLAQWPYLIGYCQHGHLHISNILVENAIRPFALGRRAWLFADTSRGARASATYYSLIETAKANELEPSAYIQYVLERIGTADTPEKLHALLPWNTGLKLFSKKVDQLG